VTATPWWWELPQKMQSCTNVLQWVAVALQLRPTESREGVVFEDTCRSVRCGPVPYAPPARTSFEKGRRMKGQEENITEGTRVGCIQHATKAVGVQHTLIFKILLRPPAPEHQVALLQTGQPTLKPPHRATTSTLCSTKLLCLYSRP
jgi:hypothetical protein